MWQPFGVLVTPIKKMIAGDFSIMFSTNSKYFFSLVLLLFVSTNLFAQQSTYEIEIELDEILMKKDLAEVLKDAEKSPKNDIASLYRRLILYSRAVNYQKVSQTIRQIPQAARLDKRGFMGGYLVKEILEDQLFQDTNTLQFFLQNFYLDETLSKKLIKLCLENKTACDDNGFDNWLAQKILENRTDDYQYGFWMGQRLNWRKSFGLDNKELLNQFVINFRSNPGDLYSALRYLTYFYNLQTVKEIADTFTSQQAFDYFELGVRMRNGVFSENSKSDKKEMTQYGIQFLNKSLEIPFNEKDKQLMYKYLIHSASGQPKVINYEKQLRFWTKTKLAEIYKNIGEPNKAQPIVEELAKLDKSDIETGNVEYLAGAVQAVSGARMVEQKILSEQIKREHTPEYWQERASYYRGRNELRLVFDAYREGLKTVPFDFNDNRSRHNRYNLIYSLAGFSSNFAEYAKDIKEGNAENMSVENKQKGEIWLEAEKLLRDEFNRTKSNLRFSYGLIETIENADFKDLISQIFNQHTDQIIKIYREIPADHLSGNMIVYFLEDEGISGLKKEEFANQMFNIAQTSEPEKALMMSDIIVRNYNKFAVRSIHLLSRNLEQIEENLKSKNLGFAEREDLEYLRGDYLESLFSTYLMANNWKAAEKFMRDNFDWSNRFSHERYKYIKRLAKAAAESGNYADAVRLWKQRANLDRRDLSELDSIGKYNQVKEDLLKFYLQMREKEPFSPIPEMALQILR